MMIDIVYQVSRQDKVNQGVAKARLAGEAIMSVPSLERLMRGEHASAGQQLNVIKAAKARRIKFDERGLFLVTAKGKARAS